jgi:DNA polymerase-3 subunit alpha
MRLIENYTSTPGVTVQLAGRSFPDVCLVEDDEGIRWLLSGYVDRFNAPTWARAVAAGAAGIIVPGSPLLDMAGMAQRLRAITAERFAEERTEQPPNYLLAPEAWSFFDHVPSYPEVYDSRPGALVLATGKKMSGFVHLHTHSEYSPLDGLSKIDEIVREVVKHGQEAVAITDHGYCSGHPQLQKVATKAGVRPIFGIEAYFQDDRFRRGTTAEKPAGATKDELDTLKAEASRLTKEARFGYYHLILLAQNEVGLRNLWAMSTESFRDGLYDKKPRMDWNTLERHSEGIIASSACLRGPISRPILFDDEDLARRNLARLLEIFGDRFYLEIQPNELADQVKVNQALVRLASDYGVPLVATVDSHYPEEHDHDAHQAWVTLQRNGDVNDETDLFASNLDLFVQSEEQARKGLAYLGQSVVDEAIGNTVSIAEMCTAKIGGKPTAPVFSKKGGADNDADRLLKMCIVNWNKTTGKGGSQDAYMQRFEYEFDLLRKKGFCGYFLMVADYCRFAKENGILVGPGRGSGAGSLVAYLCDITEVDPIEADLPFERFMTEGRTSLPDFDVDFPASKKGVMLGYVGERYGQEFVSLIGTHLRLKSKGIIKDLGRAMMSVLTAPERQAREEAASQGWHAVSRAEEALIARTSEIHRDLEAVSKLVSAAEAGTAGLGLSWDDLWAQIGDELQPYREKYPIIFNMADRLVGRMKTYGKHAAGVVISTDVPLTGWLPMSAGEDGTMVSQFDMVSLEELGLVKFDILTIRTLDTVQMAVDLIKDRRELDVEIYDWKMEYRDPLVWDRIAAAETLGLFQIETASGTRLCERMGPLSLSELSDMITIVRPGPMRSGLTETYLRRRAGLEAVSFPDPRMEEVLGSTYGCMIYQEQIMQACIILAGYSSDEADNVRKILGKKKVELIGPAGQEFVSRAAEWGGMDRNAAQHLWDQMAEFAKYSFNKAHAYSYTIITYWTAWLKFHYPVEFFTAALSTIDQDRIPDFVKEVRRSGYTVLPPDVNSSGKGFKAEPLAVRYGIDSIHGIGEAAVDDLVAGQLYMSLEAFEEYAGRKGSALNSGVVMTLARVGALDSLEPRRSGLVARLEQEKAGLDTRCVHKDEMVTFKVEGLFKRVRNAGETDEDWAAYEKEHQKGYAAARALMPPDACTFDWSTEPQPVNERTGKKLARKPLPKRCTRACRMHTAPPPLDLDLVAPYTDEEIRAIEHSTLGVFLSSSPFDKLDPQDRAQTYEGAEKLRDSQSGRFTISAIIMGARTTKTRATQEEMAFLKLDTEVDTVEVVVFPRKWADLKESLLDGRLCYAVVEKNERGISLNEIAIV